MAPGFLRSMISTRRRSITSGAPASPATATSAPQPECTRIPIAQSFIANAAPHHPIAKPPACEGGLVLVFHVTADQGSASLDEFLLGFAERLREIAFDVDFRRDAILDEDRDHDIGLHHLRTDVAGIGGNVVDYYGLARGRGGAAQSSIERNALVRSEAARMGPEHQDRGDGVLHQVEAYPVVTRYLLMQMAGDVLHEGLHLARRAGVSLKFLEQVLMLGHFCVWLCYSRWAVIVASRFLDHKTAV